MWSVVFDYACGYVLIGGCLSVCMCVCVRARTDVLSVDSGNLPNEKLTRFTFMTLVGNSKSESQ